MTKRDRVCVGESRSKQKQKRKQENPSRGRIINLKMNLEFADRGRYGAHLPERRQNNEQMIEKWVTEVYRIYREKEEEEEKEEEVEEVEEGKEKVEARRQE